MSLPRQTTSDELIKLRSNNQWSRVYLGIFVPNIIYTALLNGAPASTDMVGSISFDGGTGTLADVKTEMWLWVGSTAGAKDLGMCRLRKAPIAGTFYISYTSEIDWVDNCYLTVVDMVMLEKKPVVIDDGDTLMDGEHSFSDQHIDFDPVPVLGPPAVVWLTGADVDVEFDAGDSWVFDGTITGFSWSAPGSASVTNDTTAAPTVTYDAAGYYTVRCTVTASNGKTSTGVRHVMVFDAENLPHVGEIGDVTGEYDSGGWSFDVNMYADADPAAIIENALCIAFSEDWFGGVKGSLGIIPNRENIIAWGWIDAESIEWDALVGEVNFSVRGGHEWLKQITTNPTVLNFAVDTPASWDVMPELTVDRALWHILHWRSNVSALLDIRLSGDTRYAPKIETMEGSLWSQLEEVAYSKIFGRIGCDRYGRFFAMIDPQCVPAADRTWDTVMTLTKKDWQDRISITRTTKRKLAMVSTSGWLVDATGSSSTLYSLAMGHIHARHGDTEIIDQLLVENQTQANEQAGLYMGWKNAEFEFDLSLAANNRMIDLFPNQFLAIQMQAGDTPRGIAYDGNLVPRSITLRYDPDALCWMTDVTSEEETFAEIAVDGDIPPSSGIDEFDSSFDMEMDFPELGDMLPLVYTPPSELNENMPRKVVAASSQGVFYFDEYDDEDKPIWKAMNNGIATGDRANITKLIVTPSGALYIFCGADWSEGVIYRTSGLGGTWSVYARGSDLNGGSNIISFGYNPLAGEQVAFVSTENGAPFVFDTHFHIGGSGGYNDLAPGISVHMGFVGDIVCFGGNWYVAGSYGGVFATAHLWKLTNSGTFVDDVALPLGDTYWRFMETLPSKILVWSWGAGYAEVTPGLSVSSNAYYPYESRQGMAFSPTGQVALSGQSSFGIPAYKTTDAGATWSSMGMTTPAGSDVWENCGDDNRWIRGGGTTIKVTLDAGDTWVDLEGNLPYIAPLLDIGGIRCLE